MRDSKNKAIKAVKSGSRVKPLYHGFENPMPYHKYEKQQRNLYKKKGTK